MNIFGRATSAKRRAPDNDIDHAGISSRLVRRKRGPLQPDERPIRRTQSVGVRVDAIGSMNAVLQEVDAALDRRQPLLMTFVNPATAVAANREPRLKAMLAQFHLVAPDGIGMVLAMRASRQGKTATRISFDNTSLAPAVFELAVRRNLDIVLVGGGAGIAELARQEVRSLYPEARVVGAFSGFEHEDKLILETLNLTPRLVIAGMGLVNQESFLLGLAERGWTGVGFTCGGYLDQLVARGTQYYPPWVDRLNLRFAWRLWMEPRRLWRRYLLQYPKFAFQTVRWLLAGKQAGTGVGSVGLTN